MSLCLERWQDSKLKQERTINPQSIQSQLRTNSVHSAQGLQQLRADSDHPKGVVFFVRGSIGEAAKHARPPMPVFGAPCTALHGKTIFDLHMCYRHIYDI